MVESYIASISMFTGNFAPSGYAYCSGQQMSLNQYQAVFSLIGYVYGGSAGNFLIPNLQGRVPVHYGQVPGTSGQSFFATMGTTIGVPVATQILQSIGGLQANNIPGHTHPATFSPNITPVRVPISQAGNLAVNIPVGTTIPPTVGPTTLSGPQYLSNAASGLNPLKGAFVNSPPASTVSLATGTGGVTVTGAPGITANPTINVVTGGGVNVGPNNTSPQPFTVSGTVNTTTVQPGLGIGFIFALDGVYPPRP